ncbi:MAG: hypothetical protein P4L84_13605 [Isosphaeraceae bacterium]|nr:hypothetical protein [Isosphaeraceae bacterium]
MNGKYPSPPYRSWWPAVALILALGSGCGGPSAPPSDAAEGRKTLQTVLDAWKGGEPPRALAQRTPPIHVTDGDWMSGLRLQSYEANDEGKLVGTDVNYNVVLELKTAKGKVVKKNAVYAVTTRPQLLVLRQDSL